MAYSAQQIQQLAGGQGGGFDLYEMVRSGQIAESDIRSALGDSAVDAFLSRNSLSAPAVTGISSGGTNPVTGQAYATPALFDLAPPSAPTNTPSYTPEPPPAPEVSQPTYTPPTTAQPPTTPTYVPPTTTGTTPRPTTAQTPTYQPPTNQTYQPTQQPTGNAGGYLNTQVPGGIQTNTDFSRYPTPIPTAPNYEEAAQQQGQANLNAAKNTVAISNPNQYTPYGNQTYTIGPDGRPVQKQELSPELQQRLFDLNSILPSVTQNIRDQTGKRISDYDFQDVMNLDNLTLPERQTQTGVQGQSAVAEALRAREQPRLDKKRQQLEAQLLTRGFNPGTEGWNEAIDDFSRAENDFNLGLIGISGQEQSRLFNLDTENRNTRRSELNDLFSAQTTKRGNQINEQVLARTLPIQEYQQLVQAMTPQLPQFNQYTGANVDANPIFDATAQKGMFDLGRYGTSIQGELGSRNMNLNNSTWNNVLKTVDTVGNFFNVVGS